MIDFSRAFSTAWERTQVILFQPFDFGKWCAIGLSAFLAGFLQGGNGLNGSFNNNFNNQSFGTNSSGQLPKLDLHEINSRIAHYFSGEQAGMIVLMAILVVAAFLAFILLLYWLGARGQFMFLDNVIRNRGAISWPWQYYKRQANSLFFFYIAVMIVSIVIMLPFVVGGLVVLIPLFQQSRWPAGGEISILVLLGLVYLVLVIVMGFVLFVFREFGIPLMFRQNILALLAFRQSMGLVSRFPGSVVVFVLLRIAIFFGVAVISVIICCATCCLGMIPYIGTVILLPVLVYVKCFTLGCLEQFGPECNVWTVDVMPVSPPQPPG